mmetsp:Transcript_13665/g.44488  ORF Transcript_13665/g.44488 Transcript_13665/m.44488 type:complete len:218 (+) Transcript_13665:65-718(+)
MCACSAMSATAITMSPSPEWVAAYTAVRPPRTERTRDMSSPPQPAARRRAKASSPSAERKRGAAPSRASPSATFRPTPPGDTSSLPPTEVPGCRRVPGAGDATKSATVPPTTATEAASSAASAAAALRLPVGATATERQRRPRVASGEVDVGWVLVRPHDVARLEVGEVSAPLRLHVLEHELRRRQRGPRAEPALPLKRLGLEQPAQREGRVVDSGD